MFGRAFKLAKRFCFPSVPSSWVRRTVERIESGQEEQWRTKAKILFPFPNDESYYTFDAPINYTPPTEILNDDYSWSHGNDFKVSNFLKTQIPEYSDTIKTMIAKTSIEKGKPFDVISILSSTFGGKEKGYLVRNNGDIVQVESLRGKNILICCIFVPVFWLGVEARKLRFLPSACSELFSGSGNNYEVVMVARMMRNWASDDDAFNHFLSGFPSTWLTVPFSDTLRRDFVFYSLGIDDYFSRFLVVDRNQNVLMHQSLLNFGEQICGFPFCAINPKIFPWRDTSFGLDTILDFNSPSNFVSKISSDGGGKLLLSELKKKLVGLYLCRDGGFIQTLNMIYEECKARNLEFEIVLVYLPYRKSVNQSLFEEAINHVLHKFKISTWWVLHLNDLQRCRLSRVTGSGSHVYDDLIIVEPDNKFWDPRGKEVISRFGMYAYPFTRDSMLEKELEVLKALTLESLLVFRSQQDCYLLRANCSGYFDKVPVTELQGKIVLLYADHIQQLNLQLYFELLNWYFRTKSTRVPCDFEVVFFDLDGGDGSSERTLLMPWLSCPFHPRHKAFVQEKLLRYDRCCMLAAFGRDGKIISLNAENLLESCELDDFPSYGGLRTEVIEYIESMLREWSANCW